MMSAGADALGLAALVFVLGLKHGLDPDHLVAIDGLTRSSRSRWCGLFFSLGHGCVVTLVGIALAVVASDWQVPRWLEHTGAWVSIGVLLALGIANAFAALRAAPGEPVALVGLKSRWLPESLSRASHPAVIAAVGAGFALSFDTISHALLFTVTGASLAGWLFAALLGVVFTLGMVFTDALNGLWVARLIRGADRSAAAASRGMSAAIALLCLVLATFGFVKYLLPELADFADSLAPLLSAASLAGVFIAYLVARRLRGVAPVLR
ncbi:MAG TPA: nickel transporter [Burkholderiales bacterium]|jgi:high-affinity nickel-transport protein